MLPFPMELHLHALFATSFATLQAFWVEPPAVAELETHRAIRQRSKTLKSIGYQGTIW